MVLRAELVEQGIDHLHVVLLFEIDLGASSITLQLCHLGRRDGLSQRELGPFVARPPLLFGALLGLFVFLLRWHLRLLREFLGKRADHEVVLGVLAALDDQVVVEAGLQKHLLQLVDHGDVDLWHDLREVHVLEAVVVPDLRRNTHSTQREPLPVELVDEYLGLTQQSLQIDQRYNRCLIFHLR